MQLAKVNRKINCFIFSTFFHRDTFWLIINLDPYKTLDPISTIHIDQSIENTFIGIAYMEL